MKLTKNQRNELREKYDGRCAYCGCELQNVWHADHFDPVDRICILETVQDHEGKYKLKQKTIGTREPQRDHIQNLMPACVKCNVDKSNLSIEQWRASLAQKVQSLRDRGGIYGHAVRFGLVIETNKPVTFYFEVMK